MTDPAWDAILVKALPPQQAARKSPCFQSVWGKFHFRQNDITKDKVFGNWLLQANSPPIVRFLLGKTRPMLRMSSSGGGLFGRPGFSGIPGRFYLREASTEGRTAVSDRLRLQPVNQ